MVVLGIDASTKTGSVALYDSEIGILSEINANIRLNHSDSLMSIVDMVFDLAKLKPKDIDRVAVSIGPGSFTGIRVGVGTAKGLAYSIGCDIVGVNELDILARTISQTSNKIMSLIDARKGRVYYSVYEYNGDKIENVSHYGAEELKLILEGYKDEKITFTGDGSIVYKEIIDEVMGENAIYNLKSNSMVRAGIMAEMAVEKDADNLYTLEPYYISKTQAEREKEAREKKK
ncbi:tRNA (adenosine(37)-N6)-threonylcarbamoyltransferase complex dimerization subunit type 1 TsaB [Psychrilyobacter atlanticus]|uniref:tRNA (adenosine(37)-N6)-threonylcarbamoyltransferase complex dimerization subunit type 1 TsaB n=1 Tax=Psychrilyobacter atlanticus TaxID=271091 RepID=UPI00040CAB77|nr:tRNA (adenosine(37)-N6)-threonylcarbamoyltransferase complex dimerization subunit type 1 TsaB [Psychrilyobacter atlanticus]